METNNWSYFEIGKIFKKRKVNKHSSIPEEEGDVPFVSSTSINNGVASYCNEDPICGNCITVSTNGDCFDAFYQKNNIAVSTDVEVLYSPYLNEYNALFICAILRLEKFKWAYGRKPKSDKVFKTKIKLPFVKKGKDMEPDWAFMENTIRNMWNNNLASSKDTTVTIDTSNWKKFKFTDVFKPSNIYKGKPHTKEMVEFCDCTNKNKILYVTRTDYNNGSVGYVIKDDSLDIEKGNAIIIGDTTATCYYQENEFITGDHIVILRDKKLNKYNGLFISTMIKNEHYRFSYGRAFKKSLIMESEILLPQDPKGNVDWNKMEQIIKSLKYSEKI